MTVYERNGHISIWWFPKDFSQSHFGKYYHSGTNSCTLISLLLADKMTKEKHAFHRNANELPRRSVETLGNAMDEGNLAYSRLSQTKTPVPRTSQNLNIPDALNALKNADDFLLQEWFYTHLTVDDKDPHHARNTSYRLAEVFQFAVEIFLNSTKRESPRFLCAALIADHRTVSFVFEFPANVVAFYDSHQHGPQTGAAIAQCSLSELYELTYWFLIMLKEVYSSKPSLIEVSFLASSTHRLPRLPSMLHDPKTQTLQYGATTSHASSHKK